MNLQLSKQRHHSTSAAPEKQKANEKILSSGSVATEEEIHDITGGQLIIHAEKKKKRELS